MKRLSDARPDRVTMPRCFVVGPASANARGWSIGGQNLNLRTGVIHGGRSLVLGIAECREEFYKLAGMPVDVSDEVVHLATPRQLFHIAGPRMA